MERGKRESIYLSLRGCHHPNDFCIKMGSDESQFYVSLIVSDKVTRQCPQTTNFEEKGEPKQIRTEVLLLTGVCQVHPFTPQKAKHGAHVSGFPRVVKSS